MSITEYVLVGIAVFCLLASFVLFTRANAEHVLQQPQERRSDADRARMTPPDRYGFRRMGHCLPWW